MKKQKTLIPSLNGLRALSIILVILSHLALTPSLPPLLVKIMPYFFSNGINGVRMFFVISGFIISVLLFREINQNGRIDFRKFYIRRVLRIFPPFYFYLLLLLVLKIFMLADINPAELFFSALYVNNFFIPIDWPVKHTWSLSVEEQFYLLWPFLIYKLKNLKFNKYTLLFAMILGSLMRSISYKYPDLAIWILAPFFKHFDFLFIGCYFAYHYVYNQDRLLFWISKLNGLMIFGLFAITVCFVMMEYHPVYDRFFVPTTGTVVALFTSILMMYYVHNYRSLFGRLLNSRVLDYVGRLSYSWYIFHQLFIGSTTILSPKISWISLFPQNLLLSFLLAVCSYHIIELPFLKLKSRFK